MSIGRYQRSGPMLVRPDMFMNRHAHCFQFCIQKLLRVSASDPILGPRMPLGFRTWLEKRGNEIFNSTMCSCMKGCPNLGLWWIIYTIWARAATFVAYRAGSWAE